MVETAVRQDNYALDDTLEGRIAQAAAAGVLTALPDYFSGKALVGAYAVGIAGFGALVAYANAEADDDHVDTPPQEVTELQGSAAFALPAAVAGAAVGGAALGSAVGKKLAGGLRGAGVTKPWSVLGVAAAGIIFGLSEAEARRIEGV